MDVSTKRHIQALGSLRLYALVILSRQIQKLSKTANDPTNSPKFPDACHVIRGFPFTLKAVLQLRQT